jgi:integrase
VSQAESVQGLFRGFPIRRGPHLSSLVRCLWDSGLRMGDCLRLDPDEISPRGVQVIQHKTGVEVVCWLSRGTLEAIDATMRDQPDRRRIWPLAKRTYQEWVGWLVARAGLRGSVKWLRRSAATAAEGERPGDGQRLLGHTRGDTTVRYYLDPRLLQREVRPPEL